jgi:hypothetical protein
MQYFKKSIERDEMLNALIDLVICPAFNGKVFETDKESHRAWTIARDVIRKAREQKQ